MLRCFGVLIALGLHLTAVNSVSAFPVNAYSQHETAPVRSGPGYKFYETQELQLGDTVEIYKTTSDGWCAIRPPEGSFSWVPSDALKNGKSESVARIIRPNIRTRVGSLLSDSRQVKYVTLHKGEAVRVVGHSGDGSWAKIAPPSGEFRWIHKKYLGSRKPSTAVVIPPGESIASENWSESSDSIDPQGVILANAELPIGSSVRKTANSPAPVDPALVAKATSTLR